MSSKNIYTQELKSLILSVNYKKLTSRSGGYTQTGQYLFDVVKSHIGDIKYPLKEVVYHILNDLPGRPKCQECGSEICKYNIISGLIKYQKFCNQDCYHINDEASKLISHVKTLMYNNPTIKQSIENKKINTNILKTGYAHPMQNPESFEKQLHNSFYKNAKYIDNMCMIGYEPQVYQYLRMMYNNIEQGTSFLKSNNLKIQWLDDTGKQHYSLPDFFIKDLNGFVEVKSEYTRNKGSYKIMKAKDTCIQLGYNYFIVTFFPTRKIGKFCIESFLVD